MIETQRLLIRRAEVSDFDNIYEIASSYYVLKYNAMKRLTREEFKDYGSRMIKENEIFYFFLKESNEIVGELSVEKDELRHREGSCCLGYYLGEQFASKGYMSEAIKGLLPYLFETKKYDIVSARVFGENKASQRLLKKLGFVQEGCIRQAIKGYEDIIYDDLIFSMLKSEFEQRD